VTVLLDEAMAKAAVTGGTPAYTCDLRVRLKRHVTPGEHLEVRGWVVERKKRKVLAEATVSDAAGHEIAHAWATFLEVSGGQAGRDEC
jgi:acyl-coenzyme A thioesterase PaaI-like protein